jgi:hypothetical protein
VGSADFIQLAIAAVAAAAAERFPTGDARVRIRNE